MTKKIAVLTFFWITYISFFYYIFTMKAPPGTELAMSNGSEVFIMFLGLFLISTMTVGFVCMSFDFIKGNK